MSNLALVVLSDKSVIEHFNKSLLSVWTKTSIDIQKLKYALEIRQIADIPRESAIVYVEMLTLIDTKEDGEYFIKLIEHNLNNEESIGLLLNALYLLYKPKCSINNIELSTNGLEKIFNYILQKEDIKADRRLYEIALKYFL